MRRPYNGYSWRQRTSKSDARHRLEDSGDTSRLAYLTSGRPCEVCGDPNPPPSNWHSEDYSLPYIWEPPATFIICSVCHLRLHKRFRQPDEWRLYLLHLRAGGYGYEFRRLIGARQRRCWRTELLDGKTVVMPFIRERELSGQEWWLHLSLDPESRKAAWARPRPYLPRPSTEDYRTALEAIHPTKPERALLYSHASHAGRCATMRQLALDALRTDRPGLANLIYGRLARRLSKHLQSPPVLREDGSPVWMSLVAEGWKPGGREFEWSMVEPLAIALARFE